MKLLCGLETSQGPVQEVLSSAAGVSNADRESSDELDTEEGDEIKWSRKKKNKRRKGNCRAFGPVRFLIQDFPNWASWENWRKIKFKYKQNIF